MQAGREYYRSQYRVDSLVSTRLPTRRTWETYQRSLIANLIDQKDRAVYAAMRKSVDEG